MSDLIQPRSKVLDLLYYTAYLVVFSGFYLYQSAVASGTSPILGGYLIFSAAFALILLAPLYVHLLLTRGTPLAIDAVFFIGFVYFVAWGAIVSQYDFQDIARSNYRSAAFAWLGFFLLGRVFPPSRRGLRSVAIISHVIMLVVILANVEDGAFTLGLNSNNPGEGLATYQAFALIFTINLFFLLYTDRSLLVSVVNLMIGAAVIVLVGSRSEAAFVLAFGGFLALLSRYKIVGFSILGLFAAVAAAGSALAYLFPNNRFTDLLETGGASTRLGREDAARHGWETILSNPITGDFANYQPGLYAHNILSVWVDFGIIGFVLYVAALLYAIYVVSRDHLEGLGDKNNLLAIAFTTSCIVLLMMTKAGDYYAVPFAIGLCAHRHTRAVRFASLRAGLTTRSALKPDARETQARLSAPTAMR